MFPVRIFMCLKCLIIHNTLLAYYPTTDRQNYDINHLILLSHCSKYSQVLLFIGSLNKYGKVEESGMF